MTMAMSQDSSAIGVPIFAQELHSSPLKSVQIRSKRISKRKIALTQAASASWDDVLLALKRIEASQALTLQHLENIEEAQRLMMKKQSMPEPLSWWNRLWLFLNKPIL